MILILYYIIYFVKRVGKFYHLATSLHINLYRAPLK